MPQQLKYMSGEEFVKEVLNGERYFLRIHLEPNFNLNAYDEFGALRDYLVEADLETDPINFQGSKLVGITARNFHLPNIKAQHTDLSRANLSLTHLEEADFRGAMLDTANLSSACLRKADLRGAYLVSADLRKAVLDDTEFWGTYLAGADLRNVEDLDKAVNLGFAVFDRTRVTRAEQQVINSALATRELYIVEE